MPKAATTLAALTADPANRRSHDARNLTAIADSLKAVGAARSIVIDEDDVILAGNGVTQAAAQAGITALRVIEATGDEIIAVRRRGLTVEQKRALALYDNRTAELATWNVEQLLADQQAGLELGAWWTDEELAALLNTNGTPKAGKTDPDAVPEVRATDIQRGDLFELGAHRLLCGDSTQATDVARVMGSEKAQLLLTSPPYGVGMEYEGAPDQAATVQLLTGAFSAWLPQMAINSFAFVNFGERYIWSVPMVSIYHDLFVNRFGWRWYDQRFWKRSQVGLAIWNTTQPRAMSQVEYLLTFQNGNRKYPVHDLLISREQLWDDAGSSAGIGHPAVMAAGIAIKGIRIYTDADETVAEPFAGAGTTLLGAEQVQRKCLAVELDPKYCQVTIDRWEAFTGQRATKVGDVTPASVTHAQKTPAQPAPARRRRQNP